jgi:hypothetical protein
LNSATLDKTENYSYAPSLEPSARMLFEPMLGNAILAQVIARKRETARR